MALDDAAVADLSAAWDACSTDVDRLLAKILELTSGTGNSDAIEAIVAKIKDRTGAMDAAVPAPVVTPPADGGGTPTV